MTLGHTKGQCVIFSSLILLTKALQICASECLHDEYKERRETITSPGFPNNYPSNVCERWYISAKEGDVITMSVKEMDIEVGDDNSCNRDYLEIGQYPQYPARKLCGHSKKPYVVISERPHIAINFKSDKYQAYKGFLLKYISGPVPAPYCQVDEFQCQNGKCIYSEWKCNGADECGDKSDEKGCPAVTEQPNVSCAENILCRSKTTMRYICVDKDKVCDGIQDCLNKEDESLCPDQCQAHIHDLTGSIQSPLYPEDYPINRDCLWTIHMRDVKSKIQIRFLDFNIQLDKDTDYVEVYDGKDILPENRIGHYYGMHVPPKLIESTTNWMKIKFHSDSTHGEKGFNLTFQRKGSCLSNQLPCGQGESNCYEALRRCDDIWDCPLHGGDELSCGMCKGMYSCGKTSTQCYDERHKCNGVGHCTNMADELNCSPAQCGTHNGTFLCDNKKCIYETWKCDKTDDCGDHSDEQGCHRSTNLIIIAAVAGSLICGLLLVVALGCTCKLYNLRMQQLHGSRQETPLSRLYAEFMRRRAPPPYHEAMLTSRPYEEVRREYLQELDRSEMQTENRRSNSRRASRNRRQNRNENRESSSRSNSHNRERNCTNIESNTQEACNSSQNSTILERQSSTTALLQNESDSNDSLESEVDSNSRDRVHVQFSGDHHVSAQFRRSSESNKDSSTSSLTSPTTVMPSSDAVSIETATIASCDSIEIPKIENEDNSNSIQQVSPGTCQNLQLENSEVFERSLESLDSAGSEINWGEFTSSTI